MKKILKILVLGLLSAALLCCALPSAFAAEDKDSQVYTIGLDAMGGSSSAVAVTTNLSGKLSALPAQPALEGYTFDAGIPSRWAAQKSAPLRCLPVIPLCTHTGP